MSSKLITLARHNHKLAKNENVVSAGLFLASAADGPRWRMSCPGSTPGCREICLVHAGRMQFNQSARVKRSGLMRTDRRAFDEALVRDLDNLQALGDQRGLPVVFRPNGTSDLRWENILVAGRTLMARYPRIQFMDYTKLPGRWDLPSNYYLNFSLAENNDIMAREELERGRNVTVVFAVKKGEPLPDQAWGHPVWDGDMNDLRFNDPPGHIVGLRLKYGSAGGRTALGNMSGMIRDPGTMEPIRTRTQWASLGWTLPKDRTHHRVLEFPCAVAS